MSLAESVKQDLDVLDMTRDYTNCELILIAATHGGSMTISSRLECITAFDFFSTLCYTAGKWRDNYSIKDLV